MTYMDHFSRQSPRPLRRRPLENPPLVDDAVREQILDAARDLPNFTAAELKAELNGRGVPVDVDTVRAVLEA